MKKRKQTKLYASKKQILDIYEFMEIYVGKKYTWNEQLTHKKMTEFLREENRRVPDRISYDLINKEDLLNGTYIIVKDEVGQIIIYENPRKSLGYIQSTLKKQYNEEEMRKRREESIKDFYDKLNTTEDDYFYEPDFFKRLNKKVKKMVKKWR